MTVLFLLYDLIFALGLIVYLPVYCSRNKITWSAFKEKMGFIPIRPLSNAIWIQVVSVGEVNVIGHLIQELTKHNNYPVVISTTTLTGNRVAKQKYASFAHIIFFPFDISLVIRHLIKILNPKLFIAAETELWPNLFYQLKRRDIPIVIINGRISEPAFKRYARIKPVMKGILANCDYIGVQNEHYRNRFLALGARRETLTISGNMKFESVWVNPQQLAETKRRYTPVVKKNNTLLIVAASTHHPEEEMIAAIYKKIIQDQPQVSLVIAPRHIERTATIEKTLASYNLPSCRISTLDKSVITPQTVFILDSVGSLIYFYALADVCFVGGTMIPHGGHNILEPIYFSKPTCFGPHMQNFLDIKAVVLEHTAGICALDQDSLEDILLRLSKDTALRANLRDKCKAVFEGETQSLSKNLQMILQYLK